MCLRRPHLVRLMLLVLLSVAPAALGCGRARPEVVLYVAVDDEFARPIYTEFERESGITVRAKTDTEAAKTVGLVNLLLQEARSGRVRCDVFWNNEILGTLRLRQAGALEPVQVPEVAGIPDTFRASDATWHALGARARILLVNTRLLTRDEYPQTVVELAEPRWRGRFAIANPLFGTTATHMVCLFEQMGPQQARDWLEQLWQNEPMVVPGNRHVAEAVAAGRVPVGLTDTDDALGQIRRGAPVEIVFPDQQGVGTLFIPTTVALIKQAPHRSEAVQLVRYLLRPEVEAALAEGPSGHIPLRRPQANSTPPEGHLFFDSRTVKAMAVDFERAASRWQEVLSFLSKLTGIAQE